jgi:predicted GIY-YIG superfamily endonuclease
MTMRFSVYLLCRDEPDGSQDHYVGITTADRLPKRLMEHRSGRGARWTKEAWQQGRSWFHVNTFPTDTPALETALQRYRNVTELCPRCTGKVDFEPQTPYQRGEPVAGGAPWDFKKSP